MSSVSTAFKRCRARQAYVQGTSRWGVAKRRVSGEAFPLYRPEPLDAPLPFPDHPTPASRVELRQAVQTLEDETRELRRRAEREDKVQVTMQTTADLPPYTETELERFYRNVMTASPPDQLPLLPAPEPSRRRHLLSKPERREIITALIARLDTEGTPSSSDTGITTRAAQRTHALSLVTRITPSLVPTPIPTGLITQTETLALLDECLGARDYGAAARVLAVARAHGMASLTEQEEETLLDARATAGDVSGVGRQLAEMEQRSGCAPSRARLAALVKAHLCRGETHAAVRMLHTFEQRQLTLEEPAYASVIGALLAPRSTLKQADKALAWDLFTHMRLVAHPTPSVEMYNRMIQSCADAKDPQPEVALDLFTQMVSENAQRPVAETYNVLIRALAKVKTYYHEAFRVLRQMLEVHQAGLEGGKGPMTGYEPTVETFNALLEGTKRAGDLGRARWILAEMAKIGAFMGDEVDARMMPNEETLVGVFHTYAAYRPVVARVDVKVTRDERRDPGADSESTEPQVQRSDGNNTEAPLPSLLDIGSLDFVPPYQPQTSHEAFNEASQLFELVIDNISHRRGAFIHVRATSRLVNAYLSVALAHAPLERAIKLRYDLWTSPRMVNLGVKPNGWTYLFTLERCALAKNKTERRFVEGEMDRLWKGYMRWYASETRVVSNMQTGPLARGDVTEDDIERYRMDVGLGPREVERCWVAAMRVFALLENASRALDMLGEFRDRFPPDAIIAAYKPLARFAHKIRFSSQRTLEDDVPPHVLFHDMEILHHRFVRDGNLQAVGKIKWITLGYQLALEKRKGLRLAEKNSSRSRTDIRPQTPPTDLGSSRSD
ncbi:hypothetical protein NliqN6_5285 [Naganishia liquefaciens]|uniref:Pentacotripeptide-repeat region of PRORP domain-containing protein n=1 Tax=Naganishia liquefaciens TaxID=104408 RepID=A0A8H3YH16_9TREE|nr:hypothetical protein NliqN6_5285 [Naganishia liquefaciens]